MNRNVMIVEDNDLFVRIYESLFDRLDCRITRARTQTEALELLARTRPDLIVMDNRLPDGSGVEATRAIRARDQFRDTPIIAVTLRAGASDREAMTTAGCTAFMAKPIQVEEFTALARRYLAAASA